MKNQPTARPGSDRSERWRDAVVAFGAPIVAVLLPYRAARFVGAARTRASVAVALLAGLLLVPALLSGTYVVSAALFPAPTPQAPGLPAPQAQLMAGVIEGVLTREPPPWLTVVRTGAVWLASGAAAGLLGAALLGLALQPFLGGPWQRTIRGALRAGAWTLAAGPWAALAVTLMAGLVSAAQHPRVATPLWLFVAAGLTVVWTSLSAGLLARAGLTAAGLPGGARASGAAITAALVVWPLVWLALQLAGLPLAL